MFLVVGLGNPGIEYQFTPHNAGFLAIDRIADNFGVQVVNRRCRAVTATIRLGGREVVLAKPETYMNLSGISVEALVRELEVDPAKDLVVVYDELALPLGTIRVRTGGSDGGHNGAKSINGALRTQEWARVRIGVGPRPGEMDGRRGKDYLLTPMRKADLAELDPVLDKAARAVEMIVSQGITAAMNELNRREPNSQAE
ncbi:MAG: aminoacyl-tRNA hydrolase [Acidobacterium ailaaui]|nr:aminoacyl-tRNA hydrolase [Pseudacidobacterium ailaaui]MCL6463065.1 aminoacyl-tRNA hydrolase [Pseudacidobacterium ailaaui]